MNGTKKKPHVSPSSSTKSIVGSSKAEIETWLDKDAHSHLFIIFNIKLNVAHQFQDKNEEASGGVWAAIKSKYHRTNYAQMMAIETQLANL